MNRQDFDKWKEREVITHASSVPFKVPAVTGEYANTVRDFKAGADAAYNLLSKEISEKDEEIAKYEGIAEAMMKVSDELIELRKFKTATQALADYHKSQKEDWISVEDELPQDMTAMIVAGKYGHRIITMSDTAYYDKEKQKWFDHSNDFQLVNNFITHWRLRPVPPVDVAGSQTNSIDKK